MSTSCNAALIDLACSRPNVTVGELKRALSFVDDAVPVDLASMACFAEIQGNWNPVDELPDTVYVIGQGDSNDRTAI
jgi:hypothetical protein